MTPRWLRHLLAHAVDVAEPVAQRIAGGLGVTDLLLPSPHPAALEGAWVGLLPLDDALARLELSGQGAASLQVLGRPRREGAWAVAGSRHEPRFQLELVDEPLALAPMQEVLHLGPGARPIWWRWGAVQWLAEDVLAGRRPYDDTGPASEPITPDGLRGLSSLRRGGA